MDIDIDLKTTFNPKDVFDDIVLASMIKDNELVKHPCGVYFQSMPVDKITGLAAIPYEKAEEVGFFKIDFLHLSILDHFNTKQEIRELVLKDPDWDLLQDPKCVDKLFQIHKHYKLLKTIKPRSVQELADCIALIRPAKKHLVDKYLKDKETIRKELYKKTEDGYYFKKSHAISYALTIVLQLHLIKQGKL